ncbi:50S ribosomal protein L3 [bacterium]|nr:50S ribosomal protein L3 [bacterium]
MTSAFDGAGTTVPVTLLQPLEVVVTEIKRPETHGYCAVQVAYEKVADKKLNKPLKGILAKAGVTEAYRKFYESRVEPADLEGMELGQKIAAQDTVKNWDEIKITGTSKGKGFAGAMKRWGFAGQTRTHGDPDNRRPMSNNATDPARVFKGSRRPGRMGNQTVSIKGATVFEYDAELDLVAVTGSVPGPNGATVFITMRTERAEQVVEVEEG